MAYGLLIRIDRDKIHNMYLDDADEMIDRIIDHIESVLYPMTGLGSTRITDEFYIINSLYDVVSFKSIFNRSRTYDLDLLSDMYIFQIDSYSDIKESIEK